MVKYHVIDEAVIDASPEEIEAAYADEGAGRSSWRAPKVLMRTRDGRRPDEIGAITDFRVNLRGPADRPGAARFSTRVTASEPGRVVTEYFDGAFRGQATRTTEVVGEGRTRICNDWQGETHGVFMGLMARIVDIGAGHSQVAREGFAALERYIAAQRASLT